MGRRAQASKVKANRCYSYQDAADALDVSYVTVRSWARQGLTVMADTRPVLILGNDLKEFLTRRNARRRRSLASGELYCFTCKAARLPKNLVALYRPQSPRSGRLEGVCNVCDRRLFRMASLRTLPGLSGPVKIQIYRNKDTL
jgi:hypothetical protein